MDGKKSCSPRKRARCCRGKSVRVVRSVSTPEEFLRTSVTDVDDEGLTSAIAVRTPARRSTKILPERIGSTAATPASQSSTPLLVYEKSAVPTGGVPPGCA